MTRENSRPKKRLLVNAPRQFPRPSSVRRIVAEFAHDARHFQLKRPRRRPTEHLAEFLINGGLLSPPQHGKTCYER